MTKQQILEDIKFYKDDVINQRKKIDENKDNEVMTKYFNACYKRSLDNLKWCLDKLQNDTYENYEW